jgi:hypothetical protein
MGLFWLLLQHRQKRSTTPKVLNRVCGSVNQSKARRIPKSSKKIAKLFTACENTVRQASLRKGSSDGSEKVHKCTEGF